MTSASMTSEWLLILPVLIPLIGGIAGFLLPRGQRVQALFSALVTLCFLIVSLYLFAATRDGTILTMQLGGWQAPFGISFVADVLSAVMVLITAVIGLATTIYAAADIDRGRTRFGFFPFLQFLLCGINGALLTGDLFNLYVWFEVMLISSFALLALGGEKQQLYGTIKYVSLNLISTVLLLTGIGMVYGLTGTLNLADIAIKIAAVEETGYVNAIAVFLMVAFGIKAAVFPLFFWLPASYHVPPVAVSAIFAGLLTKVGVYALIRLFTLVFIVDIAWTHGILLWAAGLSMVVGVLGAAVQVNVRRLLAFHIVSQIGYMIMGLALFTVNALAGAVFYLAHNALVKANLFFLSGVMRALTGSMVLGRMGGIYAAAPWISLLFLIPAFSLAGVPPLAGFWAKFMLLRAGMETGSYFIVAAALFTAVFTLYSMTKIWNYAFWKPHIEGDLPSSRVKVENRGLLILPCLLLTGSILLLTVFPQYFIDTATIAGQQLMNPAAYIEAVLGREGSVN